MVYDHDYGYPQHLHLHCQECGKMIEVPAPDLEAFLPGVAAQHQFRADAYNLVVRGTCLECNRARATKRRLDLI